MVIQIDFSILDKVSVKSEDCQRVVNAQTGHYLNPTSAENVKSQKENVQVWLLYVPSNSFLKHTLMVAT